MPEVTTRELTFILHLGLGAMLVHGFAGGIGGLLRPGAARLRSASTISFALASWLTALSGTWLVYPGYRAAPPAGLTDVSAYPKAALVADPDTALFHTFAMEWKEHIGWLTPFLATAVAVLVVRHRDLLRRDERIRRAAALLFMLAFATAVIAALSGAVINTVAPNDFLDH